MGEVLRTAEGRGFLSMAKQAWETMVAYKLVWLRMVLLVYIPMGVFFIAYTEKWTQDHWDYITGLETKLELVRLLVNLSIAGAGPLVAFFDKTHSDVKDDLRRKRSGMTEFLNRPDTGP